tara:strand:- start:37562 stop:38452 length:891 start_codon:yes stop_codon:yes gene_type:complete
MKEIILITGDSGSLAKEVKKILSEDYFIRTLTTKKNKVNKKTVFYWDIDKEILDEDALKDCNHIIHLSGYPILKPWTQRNKELMYTSRVNGAKLLYEKCKKNNIKTFITASAIGYYGLTAEGCKDEVSIAGEDWLANLANDWELAADLFKNIGARVVKMRIPLLFSNESGFLKYTLLSMKLGLAVMLGNINNPVNWIHIKDAARFVSESINNSQFYGAYNLSNMRPTTQNEIVNFFKKEKYPYCIRIIIPIFLVKFFIGERSLILNTKTRLNTDKLRKMKFKNKYQKLEDLTTINK